MQTVFKVDGLNLSEPSKISFRKYDIVNQERTLGGNLVVDYINSKESIQVSWDMLSDPQFKALLQVINDHRADNSFYSLEYIKPEEADGTKISVIQAYTEEITYYPFFTGDGKIIWRDISISFVEV